MVVPAQLGFDSGKKFSHTERFGQVIIHAAGQAGLTITGQGIGGEGDDGELRGSKALADQATGLVAVQYGQAAVHEHQGYGLMRQQIDGLLAIAGNNRIEPVAHVQFTKEQMEHFSQLQREKAKKPVQLDEQAASECRSVLSAFFAEMTEWEQYMEQVGFEDAEAVPRLLAIWEKYVSEKPRLGYRPLALSYSAQGTYNGEEFLDAEQITKNKLYIYTREKNTSFDRRFLMKRVGEGWMIDAVQERLNGWQRTGL